jgi:hypothetical protein
MIHIHRLAVLIYGAIPSYSPCYSPLPIPLFLESLLLTWNPSSCVARSRPPWSQVACKLTSPSLTLPIPNSHPPQGFPKLIVRPTKTPSRSRLHIFRNRKDIFNPAYSIDICHIWTASLERFLAWLIMHRILIHLSKIHFRTNSFCKIFVCTHSFSKYALKFMKKHRVSERRE